MAFALDIDLDAHTSVLIPGTTPADPFLVECGFRQGDPLSVIGWLVFFNPLVKWVTEGLPTAAGCPQCADLSCHRAADRTL